MTPGRAPGGASVLLLVLAACGGDGADTGAPTAPLSLVEVGRIGSVDGPDALNEVLGVVPADEGVYVLEGGPARLRWFGEDGAPPERVASAGQGPGELSRPWGIGRTAGRVWVSDVGAGELEVYDGSGRPRTIRLQVPPDSGGAVAMPRSLLVSGNVLAGPGGTDVGGVVTGNLDHESFYVVDSVGAVLDTVVRVRIVGSDFFHAFLPNGQGITGGSPVQETPLGAPFADGSGLVVVERPEAPSGDGGSFTIRIWDGDGAPEVERSVAYVPVPATGWKDRQLELARGRMAGAPPGSVDPVLGALRDGWPDYTYYPPVSRLVAGYGGRLMVRREDTGAATLAWELFDREGRGLGRLDLPRDTEVLTVGPTGVWTLEVDDLGVQQIARYELAGAGG